MHVLMTVHGQPAELIGGTERHVETLASGLRRRRHQVTIVSGSLGFRTGEVAWQDERRADGVLIRRLLRGDIHFEEWNKTYEPTASRAFGQMLDELRPDVVHVHHWLRLTTDQVRQSWRRGIPSVVSIHDYPVVA